MSAEVTATDGRQTIPLSAPLRQSWRRCREHFALDPEQHRTPLRVDGVELRRRRQALATLLSVALPEMQRLCSVMDAPVGVMFTDADGVILAYSGHAAFAAVAQRSGFVDGACWSEQQQGTNGMGTCVAIGQPVLIDRQQHYLRQNSGLICCAAPIRLPEGQLAAALNLSALPGVAGAGTLGLVRLAAHNIEDQLLPELHSRHECLRIVLDPVAAPMAGPLLLAVDADGRVVGCNHAARQALGSLPAAVIGAPVHHWLGMDMAELRATAASAERFWLGGARIAARLRRYPPSTTAIDSSCGERGLRGDLADAERSALLRVLTRTAWNVSAAARELGLSRKTLHRKLSRHGLRRGML